jgi:hypothetical protein
MVNDMLSLKVDKNLEPDYLEYALALRAIGQDLANMAIDDLKIGVTGAGFTVRGVARTTPQGAKKSQKKLWLKVVQRGDVAASRVASPYCRTYSARDIRNLDDSGRRFRAGRKANPDIYLLAERLRTVGKIVESNEGRLIKVEMDGNSVKIQYRDAQGDVRTEEHSTGALFRNQQEGHAKRGAGKPRDAWDGAMD